MIKARILRIEEKTLEQVRVQAKKEHQSSNGYIVKAIEEKLQRDHQRDTKSKK